MNRRIIFMMMFEEVNWKEEWDTWCVASYPGLWFCLLCIVVVDFLSQCPGFRWPRGITPTESHISFRVTGKWHTTMSLRGSVLSDRAVWSCGGQGPLYLVRHNLREVVSSEVAHCRERASEEVDAFISLWNCVLALRSTQWMRAALLRFTAFFLCQSFA